METLAEVGREMSAILDLDELLTRVAHLVKRVIAYRTFGIALVNEATQMVEFKVAIRYGEGSDTGAVQGRRGAARLRRAAQGSGARARRVEGPALHQRRAPTPSRSWWCRCW